MNDTAAWLWAQAAVSKRLVEAELAHVGITESYLAEKYASHVAQLTNTQVRAGATVIRQIIAELSEEDAAAFLTTVEQRDTLAALFEPQP